MVSCGDDVQLHVHSKYMYMYIVNTCTYNSKYMYVHVYVILECFHKNQQIPVLYSWPL